jgi:hypothetical protein
MRNFSAISWREKVTSCWDDDDARFVLDQHAVLDFYNASSLKQQSAGRHGAPFEHIIPIPSNTSQCSYSFVLGAYLTYLCKIRCQNSPRVDMPLHSNTLFWFRDIPVDALTLPCCVLTGGVIKLTKCFTVCINYPVTGCRGAAALLSTIPYNDNITL